jgi:hypothetical protein
MFMKRQNSRGFSVVELLVMVGVAAVLVFVFMRPAGRDRGMRDRIRCVNNLKFLGLAARLAEEDRSRSAAENPNWPPEDIISLLKSPLFMGGEAKNLFCPADKSSSPASSMTNLSGTNISYFANAGLGGYGPADFLFGDHNLHVGDGKPISGSITIRSNTPLAWTAERHVTEKGAPMGQVAMGDGSVQQLDQAALQRALAGMGGYVLLFR